MTTVCCVCNKTKGVKGWIKRRKPSNEGRLSHGYCPDCYQQSMETMQLNFLRRRTLQGVDALGVKKPGEVCGW